MKIAIFHVTHRLSSSVVALAEIRTSHWALGAIGVALVCSGLATVLP